MMTIHICSACASVDVDVRLKAIMGLPPGFTCDTCGGIAEWECYQLEPVTTARGGS